MESLKTFLGLKGHVPDELDKTLNEFEIICHLRHCVVHRFGKLGSSNAMKFGLDNHSNCLDKPISLDTDKLYDVNQICVNTVLVLNDYIFRRVLTRTTEPDYLLWEWDFRKDKKEFTKYYDLFNSTLKPYFGADLKLAYDKLKEFKLS